MSPVRYELGFYIPEDAILSLTQTARCVFLFNLVKLKRNKTRL
jgi:hypothetical protein